MPTNRFSQADASILAPYTRAEIVTPNDSEDLAEVTRGLMAHATAHGQTNYSHANVILEGNDTPIVFHFENGSILPIRVRRVLEEDTDAEEVIAPY